MSIRKTIPHSEGICFITFTCYRWLNLFEIINGYDIVYTQFDILKKEGNYILGYVIMPNHIHALIGFKNSGKTINSRMGTMKRFMAYEIINRLKVNREEALLQQLTNSVNSADKKRGKLHEVFEPSFDSKHCITMNFIQNKLDYIHNNPCVKKWQLADNPVDYLHSSANYYNAGTQGVYPITNYMELQDIDLTVM